MTIKQNKEATEKAQVLGAELGEFVTGEAGAILAEADYNTIHEAEKVLRRIGRDGIFEVLSGP